MLPDDAVVAGPLVVSPQFSCAAWLDGRPLALTVRQVRILALLVEARGRLMSREEIFEGVTGLAHPARSRSIDTDLWRIRAALGEHAACLRTVRKVGWALDGALLGGSEQDEGEAATNW